MASSDLETEFDRPKALSIFGLATAAVLGLTLQPMIAIADPVALLVLGFLLVVVAYGVAGALFATLTPIEQRIATFCAISAVFSMAFTVGDAWIDQRKVKHTCARLQQIMLYEHRKRKDVPEIFRSLGCKIQS
jgi:hypothetical protein